MKKFFIGFYNYTVVLTYISLISAVLGIIAASRGHYTLAVLCVLASGVCDAFDGAVARTKKNRTDDEKSFGIQLDSICDVISFGVTPAMICYFMGVNRGLGLVVVIFYILAALIRLSFFNVLEIKRQSQEGGGVTKYYRGLPVTTISIIFPIIYLFKFLLINRSFLLLLHIMLLTVGVLFILDFKIKKICFDKILFHSAPDSEYEKELIEISSKSEE